MRKLISTTNGRHAVQAGHDAVGALAMGGANVLLVAACRPPHNGGGGAARRAAGPARRRGRMPCLCASRSTARNANTTRQYAADEMATLLDAGGRGWRPVRRVLQSTDTTTPSDAATREARFQTLAVVGHARCGDVAKYLNVDATTPVGGRSNGQRGCVVRGLLNAVFECSARRMWTFDFRLENFVVFGPGPTLGDTAPADVRAIDLDPDAFRRLHLRRPAHEGGGWAPWIVDDRVCCRRAPPPTTRVSAPPGYAASARAGGPARQRAAGVRHCATSCRTMRWRDYGGRRRCARSGTAAQRSAARGARRAVAWRAAA